MTKTCTTNQKKKSERQFFYRTAPSKLPIDFKRLQEIDKKLLKVKPTRLAGIYYYTSVEGNKLDNNNNNNSKDTSLISVESYSDLVDDLHSTLSNFSRWDQYSTFINNIVTYKHVKCYTAFKREDNLSSDVFATAMILSEKLTTYYNDILHKPRIHKKQLHNTCVWFSRHLLKMLKRNSLGVICSRLKNFYSQAIKEDRERGVYNVYIPSFNYIVDLQDCLSYYGDVCLFKGYKLSSSGESSITLLLPKGDLLKHLLSCREPVDEDIMEIAGRSEIIVRDKNKNIVALERFDGMSEFIEISQEILKRFNGSFKDHVVEIDGVPIGDINFSRVFSNSTLDDGGRLFDHGEWTTLPKNIRKDTLIDHESILTIDLKSLHPSLLYRREGITIHNGFDPYPELDIDIDKRDINKFKKFYGIEKYNPVRNVVKVALLIMINSSSREDAIKALRYKLVCDLNKGGTCRESEMSFVGIKFNTIEDILDKVAEHNKGIAHWFYTGEGIKLMRTDSDIIVATIDKLNKKDIVCLPLHDSISVKHSVVDEAEKALRESYKEVVGDLINYCVTIE